MKNIYLKYQEREVDEKIINLINQTIPVNIIKEILKYGVIAGGFVVSLLLPECKTSDIDIFVLNNDKKKISELVDELTSKFKEIHFKYLASVLQIESRELVYPLQIILTTSESAEALTSNFDIDYVQCGLKLDEDKKMKIFFSDICQKSCDNKEIEYFSKNTTPLRISKAISKGFRIKSENEELLLSDNKHHSPKYTTCTPDQLADIIMKMNGLNNSINYYKFKNYVDPTRVVNFVYRPHDTQEARNQLQLKLETCPAEQRDIYIFLNNQKYDMALVEAFSKNFDIALIPKLLDNAINYSLTFMLKIIDDVLSGTLKSFKPKITKSNCDDIIPVKIINADNYVTLFCEKKILSQIKFMEKLLNNNLKEVKDNFINLLDVDVDIFKILYMWTSNKDENFLHGISYVDVCHLHNLSDRFLHSNLKMLCENIIVTYLNKSTLYHLICYLSTGVTFNCSLDFLITYIKDNCYFTNIILPLLDDIEFNFISSYTKNYSLLLYTSLLLSRIADNNHQSGDLKTLIIDTIKNNPTVISTLPTYIIDKIIATKDIDIISLTLSLKNRNLSPSQIPLCDDIIDLGDFDISKLTLNSNYSSKGNTLTCFNLLYNNSQKWSIKLPPMYFSGFQKKISNLDEYSGCLSFINQQDGNIYSDFLAKIQTFLIHLHNTKTIIHKNYNNDVKLYDHLNFKNYFYVSTRPSSLFKSFSDATEKQPTEFSQTQIKFPYICHHSLLKISCFVYRPDDNNYYLSRKLLYSSIEKTF